MLETKLILLLPQSHVSLLSLRKPIFPGWSVQPRLQHPPLRCSTNPAPGFCLFHLTKWCSPHGTPQPLPPAPLHLYFLFLSFFLSFLSPLLSPFLPSLLLPFPFLPSFLSCFRTIPSAYGSSKARSQIGAAAETYATATATPDVNHIWDLCCSLGQSWILNPLSQARDQTHILTETMSIRSTTYNTGVAQLPTTSSFSHTHNVVCALKFECVQGTHSSETPSWFKTDTQIKFAVFPFVYQIKKARFREGILKYK